jgi:hypothetical protein
MLQKATVAATTLALTLALLFALYQPERYTRRIVLSLLRNVPTLFLATTRSEQLCVTQVDDSSWLWGTRKGMARLEVRTHLGVDLHKLSPDAIRVDGHNVVVRLPEPEVLDVVPDLSTWRYVSKASGLQHIRDAALGRSVHDELMALVQESLPRYRNATLYTDRATIADRLNREATNLFGPTGLTVKFE